MITTRTRFIAAACALGLAATGLSACGNASDKAKETAASAQKSVDKAGEAAVNGAQKAKEGADKAAADAKDAADKAADAAKDAAGKAGDAVKEGADKAADAAKDAAKDAKDAAEKAGDAAKDAVKDGSKDAAEAAKDAAADAKGAAADAKDAAKAATADLAAGDMVAVTDANGAKVQIPAAINAEATKLGASTLGKLVSVKNAGSKWVANYSSGWHIAYSKETGAQPVKGKIGQVWFDGGNISNPIGLPTAPEKEKSDNSGWTQNFTGGDIWAGKDGTSGTVAK